MKKSLLISIFSISSVFCFSQKEKDLSVGLSLNYGFGKDFDNYASTIHFNYNILDRFRVAPSFSYYFDKDDIKMRLFTLGFHYLFPDIISNMFPSMKNQGLCFYPVFGFSIVNTSGPKKNCSSCSAGSRYNSFSSNNFGFDFGVGVEYELPTLLPVFRDMAVNFEIEYFAVENYSRPSVGFGLLYYF
ncbi:MAG: porin family protein [Tannerella sp.]|nr:porin family protein [Tannerella sp.]